MIRVAVFDDNKDRLDSLKILLNHTEGLQCSGSFFNCNTVIHDVAEAKPDVVLMDIDMPGINGIEAVKIIRDQHPQLPVLMQTVFDDNERVFASICAGASGYILKKASPPQIIQAIHDVYEGGAAMSSSVAKQVLKAFQTQMILHTPANFDLTDREKEILGCLVKGLSHKLIASELFISVHTVNTHIRNIYEKLHVRSVSAAVAKAIKEKIV
ncbi:MAG: response regulator transcription factor [Sphingobacteriales bacterium]|nr:MAG: response regulator transcription factor [Sphingobacteriales bacterium]